MLRPAHPSWFGRPDNDVWRGVEIVSLCIMRFSSATCYFPSLRSTHFSQHPDLKRNRMNSVYTLAYSFCNVHVNMIFPYTPLFPNWYPSSFYTEICMQLVSIRATSPAVLILLDFILFGGEYKLWSSSFCISLHPPVTSYWVQIFSTAPCSSWPLPLCFLSYDWPDFTPIQDLSGCCVSLVV
jgi:hypothetical protein